MIPLFIPSHFGEHYQLLAQGQGAVPSGEVVTTTDAARLFSIITRELTIPAEQWRGVLMRLGISIPPNFFHPADIYHELVKLFQRRQLQLVKIPRLEQLPTIKAEEGWGYCFMQGPHRHPSLSYSPVAINSLQDAQAFLGQITIGEKDILRLLPSSSVGSIEKLAELLANHSVMAYKIPVPTAAPPVKPVEFLPATAADRPVPLGPESTPQQTTEALKPTVNEKVPPQSLEECVKCLVAARERLDKEGYKAKYTDAQQLQKVNENSVSKERFLVSFQTKNTDPDAKLAFQRDSGLAPVWATSFDQLENADTDPQLIADILGTPYDPSKDYVLHIIDRGEDGTQFGQNTLVPTWDNMREPTQKYLGAKHDPAVLAEVMTPEYQKQYAKDIDIYKGAGLNEFNERDQSKFAKKMSKEIGEKFNARHNVRTEIGANSEFTGNGLTQSREGSTQYGVVETLTLENNPPAISKMTNVKTITLKPRGLV